MTQTPEIETKNLVAPASPDDSVVQPHWAKAVLRLLQAPRTVFATMHALVSELNRDHTFWLHMMAVRSGAAMTVLTIASVCAYAMTLPFILAAIVITGVAIVAGIATVGMVAGTQFVIGRMRAAYGTVKKGGSAPVLSAPITRNRVFPGAINKMLTWPAVKAVGATRTWQVTQRFIHEQKKWMLGGTALSGAALTTGMSAWVLVAQLAVVPVVAIGSALSFVALWATAGVISGGAALYFATTSLVQWHQVSRAQKSAAALIASKDMTAPAQMGQAPLAILSARADFLHSHARDVGENTPDVTHVDIKPPHITTTPRNTQ